MAPGVGANRDRAACACHAAALSAPRAVTNAGPIQGRRRDRVRGRRGCSGKAGGPGAAAAVAPALAAGGGAGEGLGYEVVASRASAGTGGGMSATPRHPPRRLLRRRSRRTGLGWSRSASESNQAVPTAPATTGPLAGPTPTSVGALGLGPSPLSAAPAPAPGSGLSSSVGTRRNETIPRPVHGPAVARARIGRLRRRPPVENSLEHVNGLAGSARALVTVVPRAPRELLQEPARSRRPASGSYRSRIGPPDGVEAPAPMLPLPLGLENSKRTNTSPPQGAHGPEDGSLR